MEKTIKQNIIKNEIREIETQMYPLEIRGRIAKKIGDQELANRCVSELERLQKYLDEYNKELKTFSDQPGG